MYLNLFVLYFRLSWWLNGKESAANVGDSDSIPGLGRSLGGEHGYPLQYSCLENPMDGGAWWATVQACLVSQSCLTLSVTPWTASQAPLSMEFSRKKYWSGLPCPPPGDLPNPGIEHRSHALQVDSLPAELPGYGPLGCKESDTTEVL